MQIIEEKVPTIEEAKSLEIIVDVSKNTVAKEPSTEIKKTEEPSKEEKKPDKPVTEVVAKVETDVEKPLEQEKKDVTVEEKVAEISVKPEKDDKAVEESKPTEQLIMVEVTIA